MSRVLFAIALKLQRTHGEDVKSTFGAFFHEFAGEMGLIGVAAAATIEFCPAIMAFFLGVDIDLGELVGNGGIEGVYEDVTHEVIGVADVLVAGINIAIWGDCDVFATCAAAREPFDCTGAAVVGDEVEKGIIGVDIFFCETLVFLGDCGEMGFGEGIGGFFIGCDRLDGDVFEAEGGEVADVVGEIEVMAGECATDIAIFL